MQTRGTPTWVSAAIFVLALIGTLLVLSSTRWGAYLSDDTYYYIYPARDLLAGGSFNPSYIFAPLYPLVLAGMGLFGLEPLTAARWLNTVLFGLNIFLAGHVVLRMNGLPGFALLAAALVLLSDVIVEAHGWAMSEALAFTFLLISLYCTLSFLRSGQQQWWWGAAAAAALTVLTRYASLPLVAAIALTLLVFAPEKQPGRRVLKAVLFGVVSLLPILVYWIRNLAVAGHPVRYQNFFNVPFDRGQLEWVLYHWISLFIPGRLLRGREILAALVILLAIVGLAAVIWWMNRNHRINIAGVFKTASERRLFQSGVFLLSAVIGMNLLMLYFARGLTELDVFNPRYLVPILMMFLMLVAALSGWLWRAAGSGPRLALAGFLVLFLLYYAYRTVDFGLSMARTGLGYANVGWHNSETVEYLRQRPELTDMVSTGEMGIYFWTGRMPKVVSYFGSAAGVRAYLCEQDAPLFLMDQMPAEIYGMQHDDLARELVLEHVFNDSEMYRCPGTE